VVGKNSKYNFLSNILKRIKNNQQITFSNANSKFNNVVNINNLSEIICKSINKEKSSKIYNLGSTKPLKIKSIINLFYKKIKKTKNYTIEKKYNNSFLICTKKIRENHYKLYSTRKSILEFIKINQ
jgi:dTDP-4-dehydrorhamnose reductase